MAVAQHFITNTNKLLLHKLALEADIKYKQRLLTKLKYAQGPWNVSAIRTDYVPSPRPIVSDLDIMIEIDRLAREIDILKLELIGVNEALDEIEHIADTQGMPDTVYMVFHEIFIKRRNVHSTMTQKVEDVAFEKGYQISTIWHAVTDINKIIKENML